MTRSLRRAFPYQLVLLPIAAALLSACAAEPAAVVPVALPTAVATAEPAATATLPPPTPTMALPNTAVITTLPLAVPTKLASDDIEDLPLNDVRALTDGATPYKTALWSPGGSWIAAVPQDGPGLDAIDSATGAVLPIVTDTYVLEPVWLDATRLVLHRVADERDQLIAVDVSTQPLAATLLAESEMPLRGVGANGGNLAFARSDGQIGWLADDETEIHAINGLNALITAAAPPDSGGALLAGHPNVANLETIQTLVIERAGASLRAAPVSAPGEGLWLPRWSPDGLRLALTSIEGRLISSTRDGSARHDLGPGDQPAWSPDGTLLAYAGAHAGDEYVTRDIHLVDWQGQSPRYRLTDAGVEEFYTSPSWSPDGTQLAFVEIDSGQIFVGAIPPRP